MLVLILVLAAGYCAIKNATTIGDWWHSLNHSASPGVVKLADDTGMSENGRKYFYRFSPQVLPSNELMALCGSDRLGCAQGQRIYILKSTNPMEYQRSIVTASHEMLHVTYSRLSNQQKVELESLIKQQMSGRLNIVINKQLEAINDADYFNEAHSYLGSQEPKLTSELELYFKKYFDDRSKTTDAYLQSPEG